MSHEPWTLCYPLVCHWRISNYRAQNQHCKIDEEKLKIGESKFKTHGPPFGSLIIVKLPVNNSIKLSVNSVIAGVSKITEMFELYSIPQRQFAEPTALNLNWPSIFDPPRNTPRVSQLEHISSHELERVSFSKTLRSIHSNKSKEWKRWFPPFIVSLSEHSLWENWTVTSTDANGTSNENSTPNHTKATRAAVSNWQNQRGS